jgi:hypothetical protein
LLGKICAIAINISMSKDELKKLSKDELEDLGREYGIELDKRFNKGKLIKELTKTIEAEEAKAVVEEEAPVVEEAPVSKDPWGYLTIEQEAAQEGVSTQTIAKKRLLHSKGINTYNV